MELHKGLQKTPYMFFVEACWIHWHGTTHVTAMTSTPGNVLLETQISSCFATRIFTIMKPELCINFLCVMALLLSESRSIVRQWFMAPLAYIKPLLNQATFNRHDILIICNCSRATYVDGWTIAGQCRTCVRVISRNCRSLAAFVAKVLMSTKTEANYYDVWCHSFARAVTE